MRIADLFKQAYKNTLRRFFGEDVFGEPRKPEVVDTHVPYRIYATLNYRERNWLSNYGWARTKRIMKRRAKA